MLWSTKIFSPHTVDGVVDIPPHINFSNSLPPRSEDHHLYISVVSVWAVVIIERIGTPRLASYFRPLGHE